MCFNIQSSIICNSQNMKATQVSIGRFMGKEDTCIRIYVNIVRCLCAPSCPTLCDPMDYRLPGSSIHGIFEVRILGQVAISSSKGSYQPGIEPTSPVSAGGFFTTEAPGKPIMEYYISRMIFCHLKRHGWTRNKLCLVKQVRQKKTNTMYIFSFMWNLKK